MPVSCNGQRKTSKRPGHEMIRKDQKATPQRSHIQRMTMSSYASEFVINKNNKKIWTQYTNNIGKPISPWWETIIENQNIVGA